MIPQEHISHYRIAAKIGEGGMGAVYRATDTKLKRDVAVKVLPPAVAEDAGRLARFEREAVVLASLKHPNIGAIYGLEERALILELVEGTEPSGPMGEAEALGLVRQLIDALEYAHEKGVVHRGLKPANLKVTPEGTLKVLDFGLAKALATEGVATAASAGSAASSPTMTLHATMAGAVMGTAAYMAPEQARGQSVDKRADIWSFGVVVYELLTGRQLFAADTVSDTLAAVLTREPDLSGAPARFRRLLELCLKRDPRERLRDISGARLLLDEPASAPAAARRGAPWWLVVAVALVGIGGAYFVWRSGRPKLQPLRRFTVELGPEAVRGVSSTAVLSPDGSRIAYQTGSTTVLLATRRLDEAQETVLAGTEGATDPFFSPDGEWIGFFADNKMKKVAVKGGAPVVLCDAPGPRGAWWGEGGWIVASLGQMFARVPSAGGAPQEIRAPALTGHYARWPQVLPDGDTVLLTSGAVSESSGSGAFEQAKIVTLSLKSGQVREVVSGGYYGRYLPGGWLSYVHQNTLYVARFDAASGKLKGAAAAVLGDVGGNSRQGAGQYSYGSDGTLAYVSGAGSDEPHPLAWLTADGEQEPVLGPFSLTAPRVSPEGRRVAVSLGGVLAVYDTKRDAMARLRSSNLFYPVWTPDGRRLLASEGLHSISWLPADGSGEAQTLFPVADGLAFPSSISPDGKTAAFQRSNAHGPDIWILPLESAVDGLRAGEAREFIATPAAETDGMFSPDGHWMAYASNDSGRNQVYVVPYPEGLKGGRVLVSGPTGRFPMWSRARKELFYVTDDGYLTVVAYTVNGKAFEAGTVSRWSDVEVLRNGRLPTVDLAPDGKRVLMSPPDEAEKDKGGAKVTVLMHFDDELRRKVK